MSRSAYAIGVAEPVSIAIDTFGTGKVSEGQLVEAYHKKILPRCRYYYVHRNNSLETNCCLLSFWTYRCIIPMGKIRQSGRIKETRKY
ncbi:methionine adenosyltransferase domain-containing protein [Staphylococcus aureus]